MAEVPEIQPQERVQIDSKERLRSELGIHTSIDMPEISRTFEVTRMDLEELKKSLYLLPTQAQLEKIKTFIHEKSEVISETKDQADALKKTLAVGGTGAIAAELKTDFEKGMTDLKNAQGFEVFDAWATLFDKIGKIWDKLVLSLAATKGGKMLLDFFGIDIPPAESAVDGARDKGKAEGTNTNQEGGVDGNSIDKGLNGSKERIVGVALYKISWLRRQKTVDSNHSLDDIPSILYDEKIRNKRFDELMQIHSSYSKANIVWIAAKLGFTCSDALVYEALSVLSENKKLLGNLMKEHPNWESMPIKDIFSQIAPHFEWLNSFKKVESLDDLKAFNFWNVHFNPSTREVESDFSGRIEALKEKWLTKQVIEYTKETYGYQGIKIDGFVLKEHAGLSPLEKNFMEKDLVEYGKNMQKKIISSFGLGLDMGELFHGNSLSVSEALDLYIVTGGKTENLSSIEEGYIYLKMKSLLKVRDGKILGQYLTRLVEELSDKTSVHISEDTRNMLHGAFSSLYDMAMKYIEENMKVLLGVVIENPAATAWLAVIVAAAFYAMPRVAMGAAITSAVYTAIAGLLTGLHMNFNEDEVKKDVEKLPL